MYHLMFRRAPNARTPGGGRQTLSTRVRMWTGAVRHSQVAINSRQENWHLRLRSRVIKHEKGHYNPGNSI